MIGLLLAMVVALCCSLASAALHLARGIDDTQDPTGPAVIQFLLLAVAIVALGIGLGKHGYDTSRCEVPAEKQ